MYPKAELRFRLFFALNSDCAVHIVTAAQRRDIDAKRHPDPRERRSRADKRMTNALRLQSQVMYNPPGFKSMAQILRSTDRYVCNAGSSI